MNIKIILLVLVVSLFLVGCTQSQAGYSTYNQPQGQQPYVGGGCGVAPSAEYDAPIEVLDSEDSTL